MALTASYPTKLILAFRSGGVCAMPGCSKHLTYNANIGSDTYLAEAAHIAGEKPLAARYVESMTQVERDGVDNLVFLCTDHHSLIDKVPLDWTTERLLEMKKAHEQKVQDSMEIAFATVAFPELGKIMSWVPEQTPGSHGDNFDIIPPNEKIRKNDLTSGSHHVILAGLTARATVAAFVSSETQIDPEYPERLKAGFLSHYYKLRQEGQRGDELFELMCVFAQRGASNQAAATAGLAVLVYLFEICDVFEK